jgi:hypothetical protein
MQEYPIKRGMTKDLADRIPLELKTGFGIAPTMVGKTYRIAFGAIKRLDVTISTDGKSVIIDTESDITAKDEVILDSNKRFRKFLDAVTGFSTKERVKRAKTPEQS